MSPSRKKAIREIAHKVGNAAAHIALYPDQYKRVGEAMLYFGQAVEVSSLRTWNEFEIERCRQLAYRRAGNEIRKRLTAARKEEYEELLGRACQEIDRFITEQMQAVFTHL